MQGNISKCAQCGSELLSGKSHERLRMIGQGELRLYTPCPYYAVPIHEDDTYYHAISKWFETISSDIGLEILELLAESEDSDIAEIAKEEIHERERDEACGDFKEDSELEEEWSYDEYSD